MHDVFISYSSKNKNIADAIVADLEQHGIRCWYAPRGIRPGQEWASAIQEGMSEAKVFVLVYTEESNRSRQVMNEVAMAFKGGKIIVPFRLTEDVMNSEFEYYLTRVHWLDALTEPLSENIDQLRRYVELILQAEEEEDKRAQSGETPGEEDKRAQSGGTPEGEVRTGSGKEMRMQDASESRTTEGTDGRAGAVWNIGDSDDSNDKPEMFTAVRRHDHSSVTVTPAWSTAPSKTSSRSSSKPKRKTGGSPAGRKAGVIIALALLFLVLLAAAGAGIFFLLRGSGSDALMAQGLEQYHSQYYGSETNAVAREAFEKAAGKGAADAWYYLGAIEEREYAYAQAFSDYEQGVAQGSDYALLGLGHLYEAGCGTDADPSKARELYEQAAEHGCADAYLYLGRLIRDGRAGFSADAAEAMKDFEKGLESERSEIRALCAYEIGNLYQQGISAAAADPDAAITSYQRAMTEEAYLTGDANLRIAEIYVAKNEAVLAEDYYTAAFVFYQAAAEAGNADAMVHAADAYRLGKGTDADPVKALEWYEKAAEAGASDGMLGAAEMYAGAGDHAKAYAWYEKAAGCGEAEAMLAIGDLYRDGSYGMGESGKPDLAAAVEWYQKAIDLGNADPVAMLHIGRICASGGMGETEISRAEYWYTRSADEGCAEAMWELGRMYSHPDTAEADMDTAVLWYRRGVNAGNTDCMRSLAILYERGQAMCEDNWQEAQNLLEQAAALGDAAAAKELGCMLYADGFLQSPCELWQQAADAGNTEAMVHLGRAYHRGEGITQDDVRAYELFKRAADGGDAFGMYLLACCYQYGLGTEKDAALSEEWFAKAKNTEYESDELSRDVLRFLSQEHSGVVDVAAWLQ